MSEKIEQFWVNATADDVAGIANNRNPISARLRDSGKDGWEDGLLAGWKLRRSDVAWIDADGASWKQCQVYREPSWFTDKPDPGLGWRLLEKFPDEPVAVGDEFFKSGQWYATCRPAGDNQDRTGWYRRRIEPVEPEPKHYVLRVGDTVETPSGHLISVVSPDTCQMQYDLKAGYTAKLPNGQTITATEKGFEVTQ
jgi:hypothetical protein